MSTTIRRVTTDDAAAIAAIYNWYVDNTIITFELERVSNEEMASRIKSALEKYDWLVTERDGQLLGYAYASSFRPRAAYRYSAETTIYLQNGLQRQGLGRPLYRQLIDRSFALGYTTLIAGISLPNEASVALHESFGFEKVAHYKKVGWKLEQWVDVGGWQLERPDAATGH